MHKRTRKAACKNVLFDNAKILAPDGALLGYCSNTRVQWYLDRNLAELVNSDPMEIRLNFEPSGRDDGNLVFARHIPKPNICVVCGDENDLSKHHVIPHSIIKFMPVVCKEHNAYDVMPLCLDCHGFYEISAYSKRKELAKSLGLELLGIGRDLFKDQKRMHEYAKVLIQYKDLIPEDRREKMISIIESIYGKIITDADLKRNATTKPSEGLIKPFGQQYVEKMKDLNKIAIFWRQHFIDVMNPKYLPKEWDINRKYQG